MKLFSALLTEIDAQGTANTSLQQIPFATLKSDEVLIKVQYSSLNYKDALSANGHKGITRHFPHIPGIDAAGVIVSDVSNTFKKGEEVLVTGFDLGMNTHGGLSEYVSVPKGWVISKPPTLTLMQCMQWGTAGLTAAMAIYQLQKNDIMPQKGPVLVTGATGGLGMISIKLLNKLGYKVCALTRKVDQTGFLKSIGAIEVVDTQEFLEDKSKALYAQNFAGGVDTVGGDVLVKLLKSLQNGGAVAACGMAKDVDLPLQIYPFILRGAKLLGIYSADSPLVYKIEIWNRISSDWQIDLSEISKVISLADAPAYLQNMLQGNSFGRIVVQINSSQIL